jgi:hypothetical protein
VIAYEKHLWRPISDVAVYFKLRSVNLEGKRQIGMLAYIGFRFSKLVPMVMSLGETGRFVRAGFGVVSEPIKSLEEADFHQRKKEFPWLKDSTSRQRADCRMIKSVQAVHN